MTIVRLPKSMPITFTAWYVDDGQIRLKPADGPPLGVRRDQAPQLYWAVANILRDAGRPAPEGDPT